MSALISLQRLVQDFFETHLPVQRHASRHTIAAYRDSLKLFLQYAAETTGRAVDRLEADILDVNVVRSFLGWLEQQRHCGARTRNHRLAAIKSFARYVASVAPEHLDRCRTVRELLPAHFEHPEINYLDDDEVLALFNAIDAQNNPRDRALLLLLYNTGARVQEIVDLDLADLRFDSVPLVTLEGKGRKQRTCPLWTRTVDALNSWSAVRNTQDGPLFINHQGNRLTRSGVAYILRKHTARAALVPRHTIRVTPHVIRHTTAMHLLEADVDLTTIAAWLGHAQLATTHAYVEITLRMKQKALAAATALPELSSGSFPKDDLLTWLTRLCRKPNYAQSPPPTPASVANLSHQLRITTRSP